MSLLSPRPLPIARSFPWIVAGLSVLLALVIPCLAAADSPLTPVQTQVINFTASPEGTAPLWNLEKTGEKSRNLIYRLPELKLHLIQAEGQQWQALDINDATLDGEPGTPGLPMTSRLVAVPSGAILSVKVISSASTVLDDLHLLPVQNPDGVEFAYSPDAYNPAAYSLALPVAQNGPQVQVGSPAIMAGQSVVLLTIHPVLYNPVSQQATVYTEIHLELEFIPDPSAPVTASRSGRIADSFAQQMSNEVLGFENPNNSGTKSLGDANPRLGTYVAVHSNSTEVITGIAPLLQWRREQGYHVVELNTGLMGGSPLIIKTGLQAIYSDDNIPPLEFVTIFGDVDGTFPVNSWMESLSGYGGSGDHYYSTLDGDDILADVHVGRVSARTAAELGTVVGKILNYEQSPPMDNTTWYGRGCVQGDPSASGITTIYVNRWVKGQLLANGWSHVDTTWSGNFAAEMMASVGQGASAYGYRGYLGTSGISNGHVEALTNGGRLPMALLPTCDSGSFATSTTCRSESWLRAPNGGAVAAIGTATTGTHTRYNNCYYVGAWDGLLNSQDHRIGVAHTAGKLALYRGYYLAEPAHAEIWAVWNNVMGDPATEMWTGVPQILEVSHPTQISFGAQAVTVSVEHDGQPLPGARVCLFQASSNTQVSGLTDADGQVMLNLPAPSAGTVNLTVTGHDLLPYQSGMTVGTVDVFCAATDRVLGDGGDGFLNPGETVDFSPLLTNHGTTDAFGVSADITVLSGPATIAGGHLTYGTITAGSELAPASVAGLSVANDAEDGATVRLLISATNGQEVWTSILEETIRAAAFSVSDLDLASFGGSIDPGENGLLELTLTNLGSLSASGVHATLTSSSFWVTITDDTANFGNIAPGGLGRDLLSPFSVSISPDCFGGHLANFQLAIHYGNGLQATTQFAATVGEAATDQPTGPDHFGYFAFDNTDLGSDLAPVYDWVAIDPYNGGQGIDLGLTDFGWEQDDTKTIPLPFNFGFYGQEYDTISVCSNGWLAMGETPLVFYRNFPLPASHSAGSLIAPFWDNLYQAGNQRVFTWYDEAGHRFIIQWFRLMNTYSNVQQDFEVILLDPVYHPTNTGDGMIIFQYAEVNNTDARDGYATVGIQNQDRTDGINYSYWNQYAAGAAPLAPGRAILFAPMAFLALPDLAVNPAAITRTLAAGSQVTDYLHITNQGDFGSLLAFELNIFDPATVDPVATLAKTGAGNNDPVVDPNSLVNSNVTSTTVGYTPGATVNFPIQISCSSPDLESLARVELNLPDGVTVNSASLIDGPAADIVWNQETGNGVVTSWGQIGIGSGGFLSNGQIGTATVNLSFGSALLEDVIIGWQVLGTNVGNPPHEVSGEIVLARLTPFLQVTQPVQGQTAILGENLAVSFVADGLLAVNIDLQRHVGGPWEELAADLSFDASPWNWTVSGEPGPYAVIRVRSATDGAFFSDSGVFKVGRNLDWLQIEASSGQVPSNQTLDLAFTLDATNLDPGLYEAVVQLTSNYGPALNIPVALTVTGASPVWELPGAVTLLGNHPNPFNPQTMISFTLPADQDVTLKVYSVRGRLVRSLLKGPQPAGLHQVQWNGTDDRGFSAASGVYFYRLDAGGEILTGKMTLAK